LEDRDDLEMPDTLEKKIELLSANIVVYQNLKKYKLKSTVQSYELTDFPENKGVLEL
jgi:hypothetical protein